MIGFEETVKEIEAGYYYNLHQKLGVVALVAVVLGLILELLGYNSALGLGFLCTIPYLAVKRWLITKPK